MVWTRDVILKRIEGRGSWCVTTKLSEKSVWIPRTEITDSSESTAMAAIIVFTLKLYADYKCNLQNIQDIHSSTSRSFCQK